MCSYGQRSMCADLLNSYVYSYEEVSESNTENGFSNGNLIDKICTRPYNQIRDFETLQRFLQKGIEKICN